MRTMIVWLMLSLCLTPPLPLLADDYPGQDYPLTLLINIDETDFPKPPEDDESDSVNLMVRFYVEYEEGDTQLLEQKYVSFRPNHPDFPGFLQVTTDYQHTFTQSDKWYAKVVDPDFPHKSWIDQYVYLSWWEEYRVQHYRVSSYPVRCHPSEQFYHVLTMAAWEVRLR